MMLVDRFLWLYYRGLWNFNSRWLGLGLGLGIDGLGHLLLGNHCHDLVELDTVREVFFLKLANLFFIELEVGVGLLNGYFDQRGASLVNVEIKHI